MSESPTSETNERVMNDTTMPPPPPSSSQPPPRHKTGRFGLSEWNRLLQLSKDLAQRKGQPLRRITMSEVQQHKSLHDGWIVLRGKVYNLSPYIAYHPGGESILRGVLGKDATKLYDKYHRWVNEEKYVLK
jgi:cytochrome-b5 reductase